MTSLSIGLADAAATEAWAARMAAALPPSLVVALEGDLGAGKTTWVRALLRALGHEGPVPSPTYTLIETYDVGGYRVHHLDLYRLADPEELEFIGLRDLLDGEAGLFIEWPSRGEGALPTPDVELGLAVEGEGRRLTLVGVSQPGSQLVDTLAFHHGKRI